MLSWRNLREDNSDSAGLTLGDVQVTEIPLDTKTARTDLSFGLAERWSAEGTPTGIVGEVEFRTDVFDAVSVETMIARLERVLTAMLTDSDRSLSAIDVLGSDERALLDAWSNQAVLGQPASVSGSMVGLFGAQVSRVPGSVAVSCEGRSLTYRELDVAS
ncbi:hypothetical protein, partial [Mycolicibacterium pulveris]